MSGINFKNSWLVLIHLNHIKSMKARIFKIVV